MTIKMTINITIINVSIIVSINVSITGIIVSIISIIISIIMNNNSNIIISIIISPIITTIEGVLGRALCTSISRVRASRGMKSFGSWSNDAETTLGSFRRHLARERSLGSGRMRVYPPPHTTPQTGALRGAVTWW